MADNLILLLAALFGFTIIYLGPQVPERNYGIDSRVKEYVEQFEIEGKIQLGDCYELRDINIQVLSVDHAFPLTDPNYTILGYCNHATGDIVLDPLILTYPKEQIEIIVFHELGHCVLGRDHDYEVWEDSTPHSIMYPYVLDVEVYTKFRDIYMNELFLYEEPCDTGVDYE